jgi:DNA repair protein RAD50
MLLQIYGQSEVKASIKLEMLSGGGDLHMVQRTFSLTQLSTRKVFKSLDGVMGTVDPKTGDHVYLSHTCAEMNVMVPFNTGISRAILEHVVFVHQEDSLWPLAESQLVKTRFDEIFAVTKYTAAVKHMREIITEKNRVCIMLK